MVEVVMEAMRWMMEVVGYSIHVVTDNPNGRQMLCVLNNCTFTYHFNNYGSSCFY